MNRLVILYFIALALSLALTPLCRLMAHRLGYVAKPKEDRWHKRPTALFGGVAIALTTVGLGLAVVRGAQMWQLLGSGLVIAAFGLADDILSLKPSTKLIVQISIASVLLFFGYITCPDICPTTLGTLQQATARLTPEEQSQLRIAFVSLDPERDTPAILKDYVAAFPVPHPSGLCFDRSTRELVVSSTRTPNVSPSLLAPMGIFIEPIGTQSVSTFPS